MSLRLNFLPQISRRFFWISGQRQIRPAGPSTVVKIAWTNLERVIPAERLLLNLGVAGVAAGGAVAPVPVDGGAASVRFRWSTCRCIGERVFSGPLAGLRTSAGFAPIDW